MADELSDDFGEELGDTSYYTVWMRSESVVVQHGINVQRDSTFNIFFIVVQV